MRAVYLDKPGQAVRVSDVPEPAVRPGGVIVKMFAAPVLSRRSAPRELLNMASSGTLIFRKWGFAHFRWRR